MLRIEGVVSSNLCCYSKYTKVLTEKGQPTIIPIKRKNEDVILMTLTQIPGTLEDITLDVYNNHITALNNVLKPLSLFLKAFVINMLWYNVYEIIYRDLFVVISLL